MASNHDLLPSNRPVDGLLRPFNRFFRLEAASGIVLIVMAVVAMIWANSPWAAAYFDLWSTPVEAVVGPLEIRKTLLLWINDGLMAIFFFLVGLEIKREVLIGELKSPRKAMLAIMGAIGGMVIPAGIYALVTQGTPYISGWGIPMATDIAFALGVLALLGSRAPVSLKIFLTALAIIDDLGAVMVIAIFYTETVKMAALGAGAVILVGLIAGNRLGVHRTWFYVILGIALWVAFLKSGVHATIAGVLLALTVPASRRLDIRAFREKATSYLSNLTSNDTDEPDATETAAVRSLEVLSKGAETPLARMEHALHPWVAYFIMPVFALANAGVALGGMSPADAFTHPVPLGIILGLFVGKQIGVFAFAWGAVKTGLAALPEGVTWKQVYGVAVLTGIGFTMSLFIANLSFTTDPAALDLAKMGILIASLAAGLLGYFLLSRGGSKSAG